MGRKGIDGRGAAGVADRSAGAHASRAVLKGVAAARTAGLVALLALCLAAVFALAGCAGGGTYEFEEGAFTGKEAPDVTFTTLDGETKKLSDLRGKVVVMNFWATWCPYCVEELPDFGELADANPDVEVVLLDCGEDEQTVRDYIDGLEGISSAPVWALDEEGAAVEAYSVEGIPYTVVVDADGTVVAEHSGSCDHVVDRFETAIAEATAA